MKLYCISDDVDTAVGLKLTGIKSVILKNKEEIELEIEKVVKDKEIGILIVTEKIYNWANEKLDYIIRRIFRDLIPLGYNLEMKCISNYSEIFNEDFTSSYNSQIAA